MTEAEVRELLQALTAKNAQETDMIRAAAWSGGMSALQMVLEGDGNT